MAHHVVESTSELSALMKAGVMAGYERDAGFCSGGDEDDMLGLHSPSASEDSVEVQVMPISLRNKRKLAEPRKIQEQSTAPLKKRRFEQIEETVAPGEEECRTARSPSPFRPWNSSGKSADSKTSPFTVTEKSVILQSNAPLHAPSIESKRTNEPHRHHFHEDREHDQDDREHDHDNNDEAQRNGQGGDVEKRKESEIREDAAPRQRQSTQSRLPRADRRECSNQRFDTTATVSSLLSTGTADGTLPVTSATTANPRLQEEPLSLVLRGEVAGRVPSHPAVNGSYERTCSYSMEHASLSSSSSSSSSSLSSLSSSVNRQRSHRTGLNDCESSSAMVTRASTVSTTSASASAPASVSASASTSATTTNPQASLSGLSRAQAAGQQRNYKNMTRERRIEANARERTRVHTISAAFDTLRRAIPAYSHNQKLSKLSVLRIACSYIMTLGKIVNTPEEEPTNGVSLGACVDLVSRTIQTEGKLRKRKED